MNTSSFASTTTKSFSKEVDHETFTTEYIPPIIILLSLLFSNVLKMFQGFLIIMGPLCPSSVPSLIVWETAPLNCTPTSLPPIQSVVGQVLWVGLLHLHQHCHHPHPPLPATLMTSEVDLWDKLDQLKTYKETYLWDWQIERGWD